MGDCMSAAQDLGLPPTDADFIPVAEREPVAELVEDARSLAFAALKSLLAGRKGERAQFWRGEEQARGLRFYRNKKSGRMYVELV